MSAQFGVALVVGLAAVADDLARRRISNWISCAAFAAGVCVQCMQSGWRGLASALLGTVVGFAVFLIFYLLGGMGGGDVKLMAGFGALLGARKLLEAAAWTAGCGGLLATAIVGLGAARNFWRKGRPDQAAPRLDSIPYAPAIAAGVWLSLVPKT